MKEYEHTHSKNKAVLSHAMCKLLGSSVCHLDDDFFGMFRCRCVDCLVVFDQVV